MNGLLYSAWAYLLVRLQIHIVKNTNTTILVGVTGVVVAVGKRRFVLVLPRTTPRAPVTNDDVAGSGSGTFILATVNKQRISPVFEHRTDDVEIY